MIVLVTRLLPVVFFFNGILACAQTYGFRGGINIATQRWERQGVVVHPKSLMGPHIGVTVHNAHGRNTSTQLECSYTVVGHEGYHDLVNNIPGDRVQYLMLGLMFKAHVKKSFNLHVGPQASWLLGNKSTIGNVDFSLAFGLEKYFSKHFGIGVRYGWGLTNLSKITPDMTQYSRVFQVSILVRMKSKQLSDFGY